MNLEKTVSKLQEENKELKKIILKSAFFYNCNCKTLDEVIAFLDNNKKVGNNITVKFNNNEFNSILDSEETIYKKVFNMNRSEYKEKVKQEAKEWIIISDEGQTI